MSREVRRVPLDFGWPLNTVWGGYLTPERLRETRCGFCDGTGYSPAARRLQARWYGDAPFHPSETGSEPLTPDTPAVRAFAERNVRHSPDFYGDDETAVRREGARLAGMWNRQWAHHLHQNDVDALIAADRLYDFTHTWTKGPGWVRKDPPPAVTAAEVNEWHILTMGHDAINCSVVVDAMCARAGQPSECPRCDGHGTVEAYAHLARIRQRGEPGAVVDGAGEPGPDGVRRGPAVRSRRVGADRGQHAGDGLRVGDGSGRPWRAGRRVVTAPEILTPPALARMPGAVVHERGATVTRTVDHVDHPRGHEYAIHWADGGVTFAGGQHSFIQEATP